MLYTAHPSDSLLIPRACDVEWTDLSSVLSDNVPQAAGLGAAQIAQQALGLSPAAAAALVGAAGASRGAAGGPVQLLSPTQIPPSAMFGVRLPITPNVNTGAAFLSGNSNRGILILQNNNAAGGANLVVNFDSPVDTANTAFYLNFAPGFGILLDTAVFVNPLYVAWGTGTVTGGMCMFGSAIAPPKPYSLAQQAAIAQLEQAGEGAQQIAATVGPGTG